MNTALITASIFAMLAGLLHVYIFVMESFLWTSRSTRETFSMGADEAEQTKEMAFNQGFYNLFLAIHWRRHRPMVRRDRGRRDTHDRRLRLDVLRRARAAVHRARQAFGCHQANLLPRPHAHRLARGPHPVRVSLPHSLRRRNLHI